MITACKVLWKKILLVEWLWFWHYFYYNLLLLTLFSKFCLSYTINRYDPRIKSFCFRHVIIFEDPKVEYDKCCGTPPPSRPLKTLLHAWDLKHFFLFPLISCFILLYIKTRDCYCYNFIHDCNLPTYAFTFSRYKYLGKQGYI